ncbi:MAG TPA: hypothetical protein VFE62_11210 [Gemmataceae bacterium]|nr:hypothetical protein [Gemmataceae bacterium]
MSSPIDAMSTPFVEYQNHFGAAPGSQDARAECEKWQRLCAELIAERDQLRIKLAQERDAHEKTVLTMLRDSVDPNLTMEQIWADIDHETTFDQLIEEIEERLEAKK